MVFVNEWPVPNDASKARTVDHERNAELFIHYSHYDGDDNWIFEWRLNINGKNLYIQGYKKLKSYCEDGSEWISIKLSNPIKYTKSYYNITHIRMPISLKGNKEIKLIIKESIETNKFCFDNPKSKIISVEITGFDTATIQFYKG